MNNITNELKVFAEGENYKDYIATVQMSSKSDGVLIITFFSSGLEAIESRVTVIEGLWYMLSSVEVSDFRKYSSFTSSYKYYLSDRDMEQMIDKAKHRAKSLLELEGVGNFKNLENRQLIESLKYLNEQIIHALHNGEWLDNSMQMHYKKIDKSEECLYIFSSKCPYMETLAVIFNTKMEYNRLSDFFLYKFISYEELSTNAIISPDRYKQMSIKAQAMIGVYK